MRQAIHVAGIIASIGLAAPARAQTSGVREVIAWVTPQDASAESFARWDERTIASPALYRIAWKAKTPEIAPWAAGSPKLAARLASLPRERRLPLVACLGGCAKELTLTLASNATRATLLDALERAATDHGGLVIDFEDLRCDAATYSTFVKELATRLHASGRALVVTTYPPCLGGAATSTRANCVADGGSYDLATLAQSADRLAVMLYDHDTSGERAPQPRDWMTATLERIQTAVPREHHGRIVIALPLYGRIAPGITGQSAVFFADASRGRVNGVDVQLDALRYDDAAMSSVGAVTTTTGKRGSIWLETVTSTRARLALALKHGFKRVAFWRLGDEDPCTGDVVATFTGGRTREPCRAEVRPSGR